MKRAKGLIEQGLLSQEMRYFAKETIIYVLVVVFREAIVLTQAKNPCLHLKDFVPNTDTFFTYEWTLKQTLPRGPTWCDAFACGIVTRELFIKADGDFGSRKITL